MYLHSARHAGSGITTWLQNVGLSLAIVIVLTPLALYSLGLGIPFLLLAGGLVRGRSRFGWLRRHGRRIEIAGGAVLAVTGLALVTGVWTTLMSDMLATFARLGWPPL